MGSKTGDLCKAESEKGTKKRGRGEWVGREREKKGRMVKIGNVEQPQGDREGVRWEWPEMRLR